MAVILMGQLKLRLFQETFNFDVVIDFLFNFHWRNQVHDNFALLKACCINCGSYADRLEYTG